MDEKIENPELKSILEGNPEDMDDEQAEKFLEAFMNAKLIIPAEVDPEADLEGLSDEEIAADEEIDINIIKIEDEDGNEFIPAFTDDEEVEKLDFEVYGLVFETEDLATLLFESLEEYVEGIAINPFTDNSAEIPLETLFSLFDLLDEDLLNEASNLEHDSEH
jgi:hypothetical protein